MKDQTKPLNEYRIERLIDIYDELNYYNIINTFYRADFTLLRGEFIDTDDPIGFFN